jgi:hypothetical protein
LEQNVLKYSYPKNAITEASFNVVMNFKTVADSPLDLLSRLNMFWVTNAEEKIS